MKKALLVIAAMLLATVPAGVVYDALQPYKAYFDHAQGVAFFDRVIITDITRPEGQVVELGPDESWDSILAWAERRSRSCSQPFAMGPHSR